MTRPTQLYRHFDRDGVLLYVGISLNAVSRLSSHVTSSDWCGQIANVSVELHPTRQAALAAEKKAIKSERPAFNKIHNGGRRGYVPVESAWPKFIPKQTYRPFIEDGDDWLVSAEVKGAIGKRTFDRGELPPAAQLFVRTGDGRVRGNICYWRRSDVQCFIERRLMSAARASAWLPEAKLRNNPLTGLSRVTFSDSEWARLERAAGLV